jgi:hypothetical protein
MVAAMVSRCGLAGFGFPPDGGVGGEADGFRVRGGQGW